VGSRLPYLPPQGLFSKGRGCSQGSFQFLGSNNNSLCRFLELKGQWSASS